MRRSHAVSPSTSISTTSAACSGPTARSSPLASLSELLWPRLCAGCGQWGESLCGTCQEAFTQPLPSPRQLDWEGASCPIYPGALYRGPVRHSIVRWKRGVRTDISPIILDTISRAALSWWTHDAAVAPPGLLVIPAPSGWQRRWQGMFVVGDLADGVAQALAAAMAAEPRRESHSLCIASADIVRRQLLSGPAHQRGSSARGRQRNRSRLPRVLADCRGWDVLVVDDVMTTGATLRSCCRALSEAGAQVRGAVVLAAVPAVSAQGDAALVHSPTEPPLM